MCYRLWFVAKQVLPVPVQKSARWRSDVDLLCLDFKQYIKLFTLPFDTNNW